MKHLRYASYVLRHKWYVGIECFRQGLYWRGLLHDWHKLLPSEWFPYAEHFHGRRAGTQRDSTGYYKPTDTGDAAFDFAWLLHQKRADHHWQWWTMPQDQDGMKILPMSGVARLEMLCDWCGASQAQGYGGWDGVVKWYAANKHKMQLHDDTQLFVEFFLEEVGCD